jgi:hypothetical protein
MNSIPVTYYGKSQTAFYNPPAPSTQSLLCWLDAGLTSSYTSGSSTWYDLSGNGYNATLTGSASMSFETSGPGNAYNFYGYNPSFRFENVGQSDPKMWVISSSLCTALNPSNTSFPYSVCNTPPTYLSTGDWTVVMVGRVGYDIFSTPDGIALRIGETNQDKVRIQTIAGDTGTQIYARYQQGSGNSSRSVFSGGNAISYATIFGTKACWASSKATYGVFYTSPYAATGSNIDNTTGYVIANQLLSGSGTTYIGPSWNGFIQAILIYNRILSPTEQKQIANYYVFRKLN